MREAGERERTVGVGWYASDADGVGGRLRDRPADFRVREIERVEPAPVDADPGDYPHLLVRATLTGWDTNDLVARLADGLGASRGRIGWAGTKDKHAVTTQLFSVRGVDPDDLPAIRDADLAVVGRLGRSLAFGDLAGNEFEIRVREPARPANAAAITDGLRAFAWPDGDSASDGAGDRPVVGVPNYFGHQRFGSVRPVTHEVGLALARDDPRAAVRAYCADAHPDEPADTRAARRFVAAQFDAAEPDWAAAVERVPGRLRHERAMLHRLAAADAPGDAAADGAVWYDALDAVAESLRRLFVNAAQSYVFNRVVSERLRRGLPLARPVPGDTVCFVDDDAPGTVTVPDVDRAQRVADEREARAVTRHCRRGRAFVTAPLVGTETDVGSRAPGDVVRAVLEKLDLSPAAFDLPAGLASTGTRRPVLVRAPLELRTDPLVLSFALPSGAYATAVLREYLKVEPTAL